MKHVLCWLCRMALAFWADRVGTLPAVFSRHIRRCRSCAAVVTQQQALASRLRDEAQGYRARVSPVPALATRVLALARAEEEEGAGTRSRSRRVRFAGALAAVAVMGACLVMLPSRRHSAGVPKAPLPDSDPLPVFVWAESFLRGDVLQTEWEHFTAETLALATDLAEEVRVTLL